MRWIGGCTLAAVLALAPGARGDDLDDLYDQANPRPPKIVEPLHIDQVWYGWQTLLADVPLVTALATAPAWAHFEGDGWLVAVNVIAAFATTPIIHALNGNRRSAGLSIVARLAAPALFGVAGWAIGIATCSCMTVSCACDPASAETGALAGVAAGFGFAAFVDALGLAWKPREETRASSSSWSVAPLALPRGAGLATTCIF
jgi:hypothetical protein